MSIGSITGIWLLIGLICSFVIARAHGPALRIMREEPGTTAVLVLLGPISLLVLLLMCFMSDG
ncbi:MAG: hypothetical protein A2845_05635 [Candidatus Lloydbacteria bacterium RIFCSPHIGHO2_01_FULL_49_22]|uniref:Uncharacterized protein n=1 Tax=Candidatus Lloydbacteria bacterium RIFCSPHIGHO2_01_FULL_49_22 TaxID=1798658 RepID=A0A1G2CUA2_9BACT|nr:MAG: hypothetical protein A2845_05635 [Candidatus Lloydbacteria bacterium RIFCSPHIGHO2_01_FULL_49_22]OGZ09678.1 MAG: hypothetical protein A3C14_02945 [Candidatus Lloydbacteria bacterium RIFCSPHIGHO2_02_FULL_50_18]